MALGDGIRLVVAGGSDASPPPPVRRNRGEALHQRKLKVINPLSPGRLSRVISRGVCRSVATFFTAVISPTQAAEDI
jgi:hypothetical protein